MGLGKQIIIKVPQSEFGESQNKILDSLIANVKLDEEK